MMDKRIIIAGAGILDVLVCPVDENVFKQGSVPVDTIKISTGGDALNEAAVLARLLENPGKVELLTLLGKDRAGSTIMEFCKREGISTSLIREEDTVETGVNVVMVQEDGSRSFFTNPKSSLRKLAPEHFGNIFSEKNGKEQKVECEYNDLPMCASGIFCLASIFVSPKLGAGELAEIFGRAKQAGMYVCADMTKRKNGETAEDLREALTYLDYLFANEEEAGLLTGKEKVEDMAECLWEYGVGNVVIKCGSRGCYVKNHETAMQFPALKGVKCLDTTGAGDSFAAGFLYALSQGKALQECVRWANTCGAMAVEKVGATEGIRNRTEVLKRMEKWRN